MEEKKILHIVPHTHWDREWYMSFEQHRMRLVELFDSLIDTMEKHPEFNYYHMDGQYIVIDDYLEIRPEMKDRLFALIRANRIQIGPWYVLQDEYLTSGEANVRNMLYGIKLCKETGADPVMSGYFPDAFGNISQVPQILRGFDIDNAIFGRGVETILDDNQINPNAKGRPAEINWRSPDGSEIIGVMFVRWYNNAMELSEDPERLKKQIEKITRELKPSITTPHMLGMNGCDHQPIQTNLHDVINKAREIFKDTLDIRQSNFNDLLSALRPYKERFPLIVGEINGQRTNGACPLIDTASAHVELKKKNHRGQNILERIAEPLSVIAMLNGDKYRQDELFYAWKKLMQNHPHDSICCCSCDDVTSEMDTRFEKSFAAATFVKDEALDFVMNNMDNKAYGEKVITVFHTSPSVDFGKATAFVDYPNNSGIETLSVTTLDGTPIPCEVKKIGRTFTYRLPKNQFRKPSYVDRFEVTLLSRHEGIGYETYKVLPNITSNIKRTVIASNNSLENEFIKLFVESDGTVTFTDKRNGEEYKGNFVFEDTGDKGNLYNYFQLGEEIYSNAGKESTLISETDCGATLKLTTQMAIPSGKNPESTTRNTDTINHEIVTELTITSGIPRVDVKTIYNNQSENHRLRVLFVPQIMAQSVQAEGQFDIVDREITPSKEWENPCYCQRIHTFFALQDGKRGFAVATRGLNEYEILRDGKNTMALTLLRAVDQVGDWGVFPTPNGQCKGNHVAEYSIIPFSDDTKNIAYNEAFAFNGDALIARGASTHEGTLSANESIFNIKGDFIIFQALKKAENSDSVIVRLYNCDKENHNLSINFNRPVRSVYEVNLAEKRQKELKVENSTVTINVGAKKIVSFELEF